MAAVHDIETLLSEQAWMRRVARSLVGDSAADDLVQDANQAALRSPPDADRPVRPWLAQVLKNRARTIWRGDQRRHHREAAAPAPANDATPLNQTAVLQTQTLLCEALRDLDEPFRSTLFAHYYEDKSLAEIAREQGVPEGTVRWRHHEGLARIRAELDRSPGGRNAWLAALAPLYTPSAPPTAVVVLGKVLLVKILAAISIAIAAIVVLIVALGDDSAATTQPVSSTGSAAPTKRFSRPTKAEAGAHAPASEAVGELRLEGQVVDPNGAPVGGADVVLRLDPPRSTKTEADGSFAFDQLAEQGYALVASTDSYVSDVVNHGLTATSDPVLIKLTGGGAIELAVLDEHDRPIVGATASGWSLAKSSRTTNDKGTTVIAPVVPGYTLFDVHAPGFHPTRVATEAGGIGSVAHVIARMQRGVAVSGRVIDRTGHGLAGVEVTAQLADQALERGHSVKTDDDGRFAFQALAANSYTISAADGAHQPAHVPLVVSARSPKPITITMENGLEIRGRVVDSAKRPALGASVFVMNPRSSSLLPAAVVKTDRDGRFTAGGLMPGGYRVSAKARTESSLPSDVQVTDRSTELELALSQVGTISGRVVNDRGEAVPDVPVMVIPDVLAGEKLSFTASGHEITDGDGGFTFRGLSDGAFRVLVDGGFKQGLSALGVPAQTGATNVTVVYPSLARLRGKIVLESGEPPRNAQIRVGTRGTPTAPDGSFALDQVEAGTGAVRVQGEQFEPTELADVTFTAGGTTDVGVIRVKPGRRITGTVVDHNGRPVEGAIVQAAKRVRGSADRSDPTDRHTVTDEHGAFVLDHLASDKLAVQAEHPTKGQSPGVTVDAATTTVAVSLVPFTTIRGKVTRAGTAVSGAYVAATTVNTSSDQRTATGPDGSFVITKVLAGQVRVEATNNEAFSILSGEAAAKATVDARPGVTTTVNLELPSNGSSVEVRIEPLPGANVDMALLALAPGTVQARVVNDLKHIDNAASALWAKGTPSTKFPEVEPGSYTLCGAPVTGLTIEQMSRAGDKYDDKLIVVCKPVTVAAGMQRVTLELPTMQPIDAK
ncbi:MAG: sigma-70 family RNA polymerase sigma factor [Kofleriaceae bacterium]